MFWKQLTAKKSLETLFAEMAGENRLRRALGPISLTSLGVGAIIGAGIFVMTGRAAANLAGPGIILSYVVAGLGCLFAALCYAEFAAAVPVAGSAYTYAYATLGELFAWIIGWDLVLEYAMACSTVASGWTHYLNELLLNTFNYHLPSFISTATFEQPGAWLNLPAVFIMVIVTIILVIGIRESATTNAVLVMVKLGVVLFVIVVGWSFVDSRNWTGIPVQQRQTPAEIELSKATEKYVNNTEELSGNEAEERYKVLLSEARAQYRTEVKKETGAELASQLPKTEKDRLAIHRIVEIANIRAFPAEAEICRLSWQHVVDSEHLFGNAALERYVVLVSEAIAKYRIDFMKDPDQSLARELPKTDEESKVVDQILARANDTKPSTATQSWGILAFLGINNSLEKLDDEVRQPFIPYGFSGIMLGASIIFFAYIGFDSISTHSEEAKKPQRDVPIGIIASLIICTILYILVSLVISGMEPYPDIDPKAAVAAAFRHRAEIAEQTGQSSKLLRASGTLISVGALAGLTSVLLITFLSQARIFLAMARDGLLPQSIFGVVHPRFRTPHRSTILTGVLICLVAALFPTDELENMVNIGTLMAFVFVCAAVLMLRIKRPDAHRPFRAPFLFVVAPLGIVVNLFMTLFLPWETWARLVIWLLVGLVLYFCYGFAHSVSGRFLKNQLAMEGASPTDAPLGTVDKMKEERYGGKGE